MPNRLLQDNHRIARSDTAIPIQIHEQTRRTNPGGHFESNYNLLYDLAARFHSAEIQGVADWMKSQGHTGQEEWWSLVWRDSALKPEPMEQVLASHWFRDHDVVFWRSDWGKNATAAAFKSGPPEGHAAAELKKQGYPAQRFVDNLPLAVRRQTTAKNVLHSLEDDELSAIVIPTAQQGEG